MLIAVNYHYIRPAFDLPYPSIFGVTPGQFTAQLEMLARAGRFISAAELRAAVAGGAPLPARCWLITFDDGLREQHDHAWPVLQRLGVPAVFFINSDPIANQRLTTTHKIHLVRSQVAPATLLTMIQANARRCDIDLCQSDVAIAVTQYPYDSPEVARLKYLLNFTLAPAHRDRLVNACCAEALGWNEADVCANFYMSPAQVASLAGADCIGAHGHEHVPLGMLTAAEIAAQIRLCRDWLLQITGRTVDALSYPFGSREACSALAGETAARQGIRWALTMERAGNADLNTPLFLARCACNDLPGGTSPRWNIEDVFDRIPAAQWHRVTPLP